jgi:hypothetical protein
MTTGYKMIIDDAGMAGWRSSLAALFSFSCERLKHGPLVATTQMAPLAADYREVTARRVCSSSQAPARIGKARKA